MALRPSHRQRCVCHRTTPCRPRRHLGLGPSPGTGISANLGVTTVVYIGSGPLHGCAGMTEPGFACRRRETKPSVSRCGCAREWSARATFSAFVKHCGFTTWVTKLAPMPVPGEGPKRRPRCGLRTPAYRQQSRYRWVAQALGLRASRACMNKLLRGAWVHPHFNHVVKPCG